MLLRFVLALTALTSFAQSLSPTESKVAAAVDKTTQTSIALLEKLVNTNSGTMNFAGVEQVAKMIQPEFEKLGFKTQWVPMKEANRAGHFIAERLGSQGKRLLLIAHLDTVFEPASPFQKFERKGDRATGPGVNDIKGGIVVMLSALQALKDNGALDNTTIRIVMTGDEEKHGSPVSLTRGHLIGAAKQSDIALDFEAGVRMDGKDWGTISRRSSTSWYIRANGKSGHSSGIFGAERGNGAIYELARILEAFRTQLREEYLTYNVGIIVGGDQAKYDATMGTGSASGKDNIIPQVAIADGDIRTISDEQLQRTRQKMKAIVAQHLPGTGAEVSFEDGYPSMAPTEGNRRVLAKLNEVNRDMGLPEMQPLNPLQRGAGDISFVAQYVDGIAGMGAIGSGAHAEGESVDLSLLPLQAKRAALLIYRLTR